MKNIYLVLISGLCVQLQVVWLSENMNTCKPIKSKLKSVNEARGTSDQQLSPVSVTQSDQEY